MKVKWESIKEDDTRIVTKFLFFPRTVNKETRWLETASWRQEVVISFDLVGYALVWSDVCWLDKESEGIVVPEDNIVRG